MNSIEKYFSVENRWFHQSEFSREPILAFLDDISALVLAYTKLYIITEKSEYLHKADNLIQVISSTYSHTELALFQYRSNQADYLIAEKVEVMDSVMPSSNSMLCEAFLWMGILQNKAKYTIKGRDMLGQILERAIAHPAYFANWLRIYSDWIEHPKALLKYNPSVHSKENLDRYDWCIDKEQLFFIPYKENSDYLACVGDYCFAPAATIEEVDKQLATLI
jgi:uncharacterized protein YyaL (SSP411 family)